MSYRPSNCLLLSVKVQQARNFTVSGATCNAMCLVTFDGATKTTKRAKNTAEPTWKTTLKLRLSGSPKSQYVRCIVYDLEGTNYIYIGECRISILSLFKTNKSNYNFNKDLQWYPILNRSSLRERNLSWSDHRALSYACGEIQLGFKLTVAARNNAGILTNFNAWSLSLLNNFEFETLKNGGSNEITEEDLEVEDVLDENAFDDVIHLRDDEDDIDFEQGSTDEEEEEVGNEIGDLDIIQSIRKLEGLQVISSSSSLSSSDSEISSAISFSSLESRNSSENPSAEILLDGVDTMALTTGSELITDQEEISRSPPSDALTSVGAVERLDHMLSIQDKQKLNDIIDEEEDAKLLSRRAKRIPRRKKSLTGFKVSKREHAIGVVVLVLRNISNLPTLKNKISKTYYDMDPFVILSFGRRVFKSSWRKRTLNPEFNEICAFEVYPDEKSFQFIFQVVDRDSFSYHDKIATASVSLTELLANSPADDVYNFEIPLELIRGDSDNTSSLALSFQFLPYDKLKKHFWYESLVSMTEQKEFDVIELGLLLEQIGQFSSNEINDFFYRNNKSPWKNEKISIEELAAYLKDWTASNDKHTSPFNNIQRCPICLQRVRKTRNSVKSKLNKENDLITHFAICKLKKNSRKKTFLSPSYVSLDFASKRWFSRFLISLTHGKYALGSNNANILVQDRDSGIIIDEKISMHVKLGIRIIYNGRGVESKKFKNLLKNQTLKQGRKFDSPRSVSYIPSFIKFHSLDLSECLETNYNSFNEFFYRKLKPGARNPESSNPGILLSPADCRCTVFPSLYKAQEIWIKGKNFSLSKLIGDCDKSDQYPARYSSIAIFRLAPQDYHRFHAPCDGTIGKIHHISGQYYTVNPMAIRTHLDVFGENIRCIIPISSPHFGTVLYIPVGATMVGSIILNCKEGDKVSRGDDMGFFKFGGSTIIMIVPQQKVQFDTDLIKNSNEKIETLLKVGMSVGHSPSLPEYPRIKRVVHDKAEFDRIRRTISVTNENANDLAELPWEYYQLKNFC